MANGVSSAAANIFRDFKVDGVPASGANEPKKPEIRGLFSSIDEAINAAAQSLPTYDTAADLPTSPPPADGTQARVFNDSNDTNNGVWIFKNGSWSFDDDYYNPFNLILSRYLEVQSIDGSVLRVTGGDGFYIDYPVPDPNAQGTIDPGIDVTHTTSGLLVLEDPDGFFVDLNDLNASQSDDADDALYGARNAANLAFSAALAREVNTTTAGVYWKYNHLIGSGQSLMAAAEGWPAFSKTAIDGNVMVGASIRPANESYPGFQPMGGVADFQPAVATVEQLAADTYQTYTTLTDAEVAALPQGDAARGETVLSVGGNAGKLLHNQYRGALTDPEHLFVLSSVGVGGTNIEKHLEGAPNNYWARWTGIVDAARAAAGTDSYGIVADVWMQGESNYITTTGGSTDRATYLANLTALRQSRLDYLAANVPDQVDAYGQSILPAMFLYQTAGSWVRDLNGTDQALSISDAQREFCETMPGCYLFAPSYPVTNNTDGHLDSNGYRWMGAQLAKVFHLVVERRRGWRPLSSRGSTLTGNVLAIDYHVPVPPLVFDTPYNEWTAQDYADKGYTVVDADGVVPITNVRIVLDTIVEITLARVPTGSAWWRYGDETYHAGSGCLRDSDPTVAFDEYVYQAGSGQIPAMDIPALAGKPFPLWNWAVLENRQIQ